MIRVVARAVLAATLAGVGRGAPAVPVDFSTAGFRGGGEILPLVPALIAVAPSGGDDTAALQRAIDYVGWSGARADGWRGAVALQPGTFRISGQLRLTVPGVVLRGNSTVLVATGPGRRTLIDAAGPPPAPAGPEVEVTGDDLPEGSAAIPVAGVAGFAAGDEVLIRRPSTAAWISALGADQFTGNYKEIRLDWLPGSRDLAWRRTILRIDPATPTLYVDAPITMALTRRFGGGTVQKVAVTSCLHQIGLENFSCESEGRPDRPQDEERAWLAVALDQVEDAYVRGVATRGFVSAGIWVGAGARRVTIQDCSVDAPVGEAAGWRRLGIYVGGQQVLAQRCEVDDCREGFAVGHCAAGPNVFLDCTALRAQAASGPLESWSCGTLFDTVAVSGSALRLANLGSANQGAGWAAANSWLWNCLAEPLEASGAPGAPNHVQRDVTVPSLYRAQLASRRGAAALLALAPTEPALDAPAAADPAPPQLAPLAGPAAAFQVTRGHFAFGDQAFFGAALNNAWWKGQLNPGRAAQLGTSLTRWAPGRVGPGLTEDLPALLDRMAAASATFYHAWPGLWYDRRRDEHSTTTREDGGVWAPFFESPWARSGRGRAADGLSKYDLDEYNPWYDQRLRDFAELAATRGVVLVHYFYNNHNVEEAAAHWADFPWRPANCLQATGFPEPPPFEGASQSTIHVAEQFYDVSNPVRRRLHEKYIEHGLDALAPEGNVIHTLGFQFAGPQSFQEFFLDTVAAWERKRGRRVHVALETSKAVTDAVLANPRRAALVDVIDQRYWQYLPDGSLFAPDGEGRRAFREIRTAQFGRDAVPPTTPQQLYRQVREYVDHYPDKAIVAAMAGAGPIPIFLAGGAAPTSGEGSGATPADLAFLKFARERLGGVLGSFRLRPDYLDSDTECAVSDRNGRNVVIYSLALPAIRLARPLPAGEAVWFNPRTGAVQPADLGDHRQVTKPTAEAWLLYFYR